MIDFLKIFFSKFLNNKNFENLLPQKLLTIRYCSMYALHAYKASGHVLLQLIILWHIVRLILISYILLLFFFLCCSAGDDADIIDESLGFFKANVFFKSYEVKVKNSYDYLGISTLHVFMIPTCICNYLLVFIITFILLCILMTRV